MYVYTYIYIYICVDFSLGNQVLGFKLGPEGPSARAEDLLPAGVKGPGRVSDSAD